MQILKKIKKIVCKKKHRMSFRETFDLTGLPIVTFQSGYNKFNFILDTGAAYNAVDSAAIKEMLFESLDGTTKVYGIEGNLKNADRVVLYLSYKDEGFYDVFACYDLSKVFAKLKNAYGATVHGLISSSFLEKYKYKIDFKSMVAYAKL